MNRFSSRGFAIALAIALLFGLTAAMMPATAQAGGPGRPHYYQHPQYTYNSGGSARWSTPKPPKVVVRDNGGDCDWWYYVRTKHGYKRVYNTCCRFGNETRDYAVYPRQVWSTP